VGREDASRKNRWNVKWDCESENGSGCELREGALERHLLVFAIKIYNKKPLNDQSYVAGLCIRIALLHKRKEGTGFCVVDLSAARTMEQAST
jgi:hypothetical protein